MHNQIQESQVTSHGKPSVGLNVLSSEEDPGDVSQHLIQPNQPKPVPPFGWEPAPQWAKDAKADDARLQSTQDSAEAIYPCMSCPTCVDDATPWDCPYKGPSEAHVAGLLFLPTNYIPLVSIEQLADVLEDGNARKGWMLSKLFYEASGGADHTQTDAIISRCAPLREYLDLKTGQKAASAMNGGTL